MEIESENQFNEIILDKDQEYKYIFVDFYAKWCGPCKKIAPKIHKLSEKHQNIKFLKVDVDEFSELKKKYYIRYMPTFLFFKVGLIEPICDAIEGADLDKIKKLLLFFNNK